METPLIIFGVAIALVYFGSGVVILFVRRARPLFRFAAATTFVCWTIAGSLPTPGASSDNRSQWLAPAAGLVVLAGSGAISFLAAFRGHPRIERIVGIAGLLLFTLTTPFLIADLYESAAFLKTVRQQHALLR